MLSKCVSIHNQVAKCQYWAGKYVPSLNQMSQFNRCVVPPKHFQNWIGEPKLKKTENGRWPNMEDDLQWKMTQNGKWPNMEDTSSLELNIGLVQEPNSMWYFP